ncbi:membrane hypothetical protein [[Clostridium] ultunense Esp]|nr:membrane hypothetical protein [[Clostridium] ultunense Esp]
MTSYRNIFRFVIQDFLLRKKKNTAILGFIPIIFLLNGLFSFLVKTFISVEDLIMTFRFEFLYNPLFILLLGINSDLNTLWMMQRYRRREDLATYLIWLVLLYAFLFTLVILLSGIVGYHFFLQRPLADVSSLSLFAVILFLLLVAIGLLFTSIAVASNRITASFFMIFLVILDKESTTVIIPFILQYGYRVMPIVMMILLGIMIILMSFIIGKQMKQKDFFH